MPTPPADGRRPRRPAEKRRSSDGNTRPAHDSASDRAHKVVRRTYGAAADYRCNDDRTHRATEWSYDHLDPDEVASPEGWYSRSPSHYRPRCTSCHRRMDGRVTMIRGGVVAPLFGDLCGHVRHDAAERCGACRRAWIQAEYPPRDLERWS